jgi:hypothetical protein
MSLTDLQKAAGKVFVASCQAELDRVNAGRPPGGYVSPLWRVVRHPCPVRGTSTGIELTERYTPNPALWVCYCSVIAPMNPEAFPHRDCDGGKLAAAAGLLAFVWKHGWCPACELVLRSETGRLFLAASRPPDRKRVVHAG